MKFGADPIGQGLDCRIEQFRDQENQQRAEQDGIIGRVVSEPEGARE